MTKWKVKFAKIDEIKKQRSALRNTISLLDKDIVKYSIEVKENQSFALRDSIN